METDIFKEEAYDLLDDIEETLLDLGKNPTDNELINSLFRAFHTIKGSGAMFGFNQVADFTHRVETVIDAVRQGLLSFSEDLLETILHSRDQILRLIDTEDPEAEFDSPESKSLMEQLTALVANGAQDASAPDPEEENLPETPGTGPLPPEFSDEISELLDSTASLIKELTCDPQANKLVNKLCRTIHTIQGSAAIYEHKGLADFSSQVESAVNLVKQGAARFDEPCLSLLREARDQMLAILQTADPNEVKIQEKSTAITDKLQDWAATASAGATPTDPESPTENQPDTPTIDLDLTPEQLISPEMVQHFMQEAEELVQEIETDLLQMINAPDDQELIAKLFRNIHSFKGNCGFLGFGDLEKLSHGMETVLDVIKSGAELDKPQIAETLLSLLDILKETLTDIGQGADGKIKKAPLYLDMLNDLLPKDQQLDICHPPKIGEILIKQGAVTEEQLEEALEAQMQPIGKILVESGTVSENQVEKALQEQNKARATKKATPATGRAPAIRNRQDIRVDLVKLDSLINMIGEMVIAENMLVNNPDLQGLELDNFHKAGQHMSKIVRELQEMAMIIRMIPVAGLFKRMTRLVHDLARKSAKKVDLQLVGESTEVDKTVIELITDPLVHLIRNSMDHGLEGPEERLTTGKEPTGIVKLAASHEEGNVQITITDDGRGLNREKIIAKALEKGIIDDDGSQMSDSEVFNLIFLPGFSTADQITDVSGRGVGMDVVRQNLEQIKGKIDIRSKAGQGTKIILRIPLTLAIIEGMLIRTGTSRYIIPLLSIQESFQPSQKQITVSPDGQELVKVRDHLLPVIRLHKLHNITPEFQKLDQGVLIVLESKAGNLCLFVDEIMGQQQTVIKGLSGYINNLGNVGGVSGCTIMGDGEVCLILDIQTIGEICLND